MSRNLSDSKQERDLFNRIAKLEQQMRERGTTQSQGYDAIPQSSYYLGQFTTTLAASGLYTRTFAFRHAFVGDAPFQAQQFSPILSVAVGTNNLTYPYDYLWPSGSSLTSAEKALQISITRNYTYGLLPQDPRNTLVLHVQLRNLDTNSHTYYGHLEAIGNAGLGPLTPLDLF